MCTEPGSDQPRNLSKETRKGSKKRAQERKRKQKGRLLNSWIARGCLRTCFILLARGIVAQDQCGVCPADIPPRSRRQLPVLQRPHAVDVPIYGLLSKLECPCTVVDTAGATTVLTCASRTKRAIWWTTPMATVLVIEKGEYGERDDVSHLVPPAAQARPISFSFCVQCFRVQCFLPSMLLPSKSSSVRVRASIFVFLLAGGGGEFEHQHSEDARL
jgi:hypothetical protein